MQDTTRHRYQIDRTFSVVRTFYTTAASEEDALDHPENWEEETTAELTLDVLETEVTCVDDEEAD